MGGNNGPKSSARGGTSRYLSGVTHRLSQWLKGWPLMPDNCPTAQEPQVPVLLEYPVSYW